MFEWLAKHSVTHNRKLNLDAGPVTLSVRLFNKNKRTTKLKKIGPFPRNWGQEE